MFKQIEDAEALIVTAGIYKPTQVFEGPGGGLFVRANGGFARIKENGSTSNDRIKLDNLLYEGVLYRDQWGRLCAQGGGKRKPLQLAGGDELKLLPVDDK